MPCSRAESCETLRFDIDATNDAHAFDRFEICRMLVGHAAGTEN
jgi:hypothetical protein